jgi:hypothetical protein
MGAELDVRIWPISASGLPRTAVNTVISDYVWKPLGSWQWDPNWQTGNSGGDMGGDFVCHSGMSTANNASASIVTECGTLGDRADYGPYEGSWHYSRRLTTMNGCPGDSGGTVWRTSWYAGIVAAGSSPLGSGCYDLISYSHVGYMPFMQLTAPIGFS